MRARLCRLLCAGLVVSGVLSAQEIKNWTAPPYWFPPEHVAVSENRLLGEIKSPAAAKGGRAAASASPALAFHAVFPCRVADTRGGFPGQYGPPSVPAFTPRSFTIGGQCGIPVGVAAVSFTFEVTTLVTGGNLVVFPQGASSQPVVSSLNWMPAEFAIANSAVIGLGISDGITVFVNGPAGASPVDLIIDVNGYYGGDIVTSVVAGTGLTGGGTGSVTLGIADQGVGTNQLSDSSVTGAKLGPNAVSLFGEVTGPQSATLVPSAIPANAPNSIVRRDGAGRFESGGIVLDGDLTLRTNEFGQTWSTRLYTSTDSVFLGGGGSAILGPASGNIGIGPEPLTL